MSFMQTTIAEEDYLKAVFAMLTQGEQVTTGRLAKRLGVSPPSVSAMLKRLTSEDLVERPGSREVTLTSRGREEALRVVRRHRIVETFLSDVLGVPWDEVHAEAEVLEHAVSDRLEERIAAVLGHPTHDPHGDPIPPRSGTHHESWSDPLVTARPGDRFAVERVSDRDSAALRYLAELGIRPGVTLEVTDRGPFGGPVWVRLDGELHALGVPLAHLIHGTVLEVGS
ncbi:MAG: metal-dependent transcriptional regulator [Euzebyales bacterium]|nr:metal-dependent transcriptional regulator [Euzebyales bacterium]MBA3620759.1 metal-dependent transcriptional regulator [Euzebyales bacterium]